MVADTTPRFGLDGKIVLVTGASRGIGRACALGCAGSGADVIVGVRKAEDGEALVAEIEGLGRRALGGADGPHRSLAACATRSPRRIRHSAASTCWSTMSASARKTWRRT